MRRAVRWGACVLLVALAGCGREPVERAADASRLPSAELAAMAPAAPAPAKILSPPPGTFLAYEHDARVRLPGKEVPARLAAVRDACQQARFGDCAVLEISQRGDPDPGGEITVRTAPAGVEPLLKLAGEGGDIAQRSTRAEDLAQQVADTRLTRARLENEHARLLEYQRRGCSGCGGAATGAPGAERQPMAAAILRRCASGEGLQARRGTSAAVDDGRG